MSKQAKPRNVATLLNRANLEYLSSIVFHTVLVAKEYVKTSKTQAMWLHCLIERNLRSIIDSIPHCPSCKRICQNKQNQEMWLHC